ncbi:hypothetical protein AVEN_33549-1 [Araneus ventricosus]|uniref:Uncharacterized protein n=1 Tax=Araneus ventricosus TaxID=182803 RepID=A0A4Y2R273_ARAVE|nr:hypothetical protein AVEN_33549-1 [Araneus ventricosus]
MALLLHTGGGKPEGSRSKFYLFTYILICLPPNLYDLVSVRVQSSQQLKKSPSEVPQLKDHWSTTTLVRESSRSFFTDEEKKAQTPHAKFPEIRGERDHTSCTPSQEKKNGKEKERVFLTRHFSPLQKIGFELGLKI